MLLPRNHAERENSDAQEDRFVCRRRRIDPRWRRSLDGMGCLGLSGASRPCDGPDQSNTANDEREKSAHRDVCRLLSRALMLFSDEGATRCGHLGASWTAAWHPPELWLVVRSSNLLSAIERMGAPRCVRLGAPSLEASRRGPPVPQPALPRGGVPSGPLTKALASKASPPLQYPHG